jgi:hypothetical protein
VVDCFCSHYDDFSGCFHDKASDFTQSSATSSGNLQGNHVRSHHYPISFLRAFVQSVRSSHSVLGSSFSQPGIRIRRWVFAVFDDCCCYCQRFLLTDAAQVPSFLGAQNG